jgi:hypothetical protein
MLPLGESVGDPVGELAAARRGACDGDMVRWSQCMDKDLMLSVGGNKEGKTEKRRVRMRRKEN